MVQDEDAGAATLASVPLGDQVLADAPASEGGASTREGQQFGPWQLLRPLGVGGMGEVWLARRSDGLYESLAAIKLLRSDLAGPGLSARFARERALLGRLQHPGIARLLDAGIEHGVAYLVLEYVQGRTLSEYCATQGLDVAGRVRLLLGIAEAVAYAHGQLIVHRDLKPGNVVVDEQGRPKLLDFGIAALLDEADEAQGDGALTRLAGRRLTPAYAAPEQLMGEPIGTAADVYSLGVMLFELLSGGLPYTRGRSTREAIEHAVLNAQPLRITQAVALPGGPGEPSDRRLARGDLEAVVNKALRKNPAERYVGVQALIDDLIAWQQHRPVSVRREDWQHRLGLWVRRHAGLALGGSLVLLSLAAGLVVSLQQWHRAEAAALRSERAIDYLAELLAGARPNEAGGRPQTVVDLLEKSRLELDQRFADDPALEVRLLDVIGHAQHELGRMDRAIEQYERRRVLLEAMPDADPAQRVQARVDLATAYNAIGVTTKVSETLAPVLPQLLHQQPRTQDEWENLRAVLLMLMSSHVKLGQFAAAEAMVPDAIRVGDQADGPGSSKRLSVQNHIAVLRYTQGRFRAAEALLKATQPFWAQNLKTDPVEVFAERRILMTTQMRLLAPRDFVAEVAQFRSEAEPIFGADSELIRGLRSELAQWLIDQGRYADALREREALWQESQARGGGMPVLQLPRHALLILAQALQPGADRAALAAEARMLGDRLQAETGIQGPSRADMLLLLARLGLLLDPALAAQSLQALKDAGLGMDPQAPVFSRARQLEGELARQQGELPRSRALLQRRVTDLDAVDEPNQAPRWRAQLTLACTLLRLGDMAAAQQALRRADLLRPSSFASGHPMDRWRERLGRGDASAPADALL